ncbi:hypothetical protein L0337_43240 [candidate division KSB1 bacterium]|nr:hypothetical protein [candidate division KSB1 bacterium]
MLATGVTQLQLFTTDFFAGNKFLKQFLRLRFPQGGIRDKVKHGAAEQLWHWITQQLHRALIGLANAAVDADGEIRDGRLIVEVAIPFLTFPQRLLRLMMSSSIERDAKISIVPGPVLSAKQRYQNFIRLSYGHPWSVKLEQALATLGRLASSI